MRHLVICLVLAVVGCASTKMASVTDPTMRDKRYQRFVVFADIADLEMRGRMERRVVERLVESGSGGEISLDLFPPTREYTDVEIKDQLLERGIDGFLVLMVNESGTTRSHVPVSGATTTTNGTARVVGDRVHYDGQTRTNVSGGYDITRPWASFSTELYDVAGGNRTWVATAQTSGNGYAGFGTVANSYCDKIVSQLLADRLLSQGR